MSTEGDVRLTEQEKRELSIWTIYSMTDQQKIGQETDPVFVARRFVLDRPTDDMLIASTLDDLRSMLPQGLYRMPRMLDEDISIIEVWI